MPDTSNQPAVSIRDLAVQYGERRALDGVSLEVAGGAVVGLLGPNGSGKSTVIAALAGLREPAAGTVEVLGTPPTPAARARLGIVFQEPCLDPMMAVEETLALHGRLYGMAGDALHRRIEELLARFGLSDRARDATRTLSGGLKRRLELARSLLPSPELLLLDEPTTGLDPDSRRTFWARLREERERGLTILLATNDVQEAERECDTVAFIHHGKLVAQGAPFELKRGLRNDAVRVECADGRAAELRAAVAGWPGVGTATAVESVLHVTVDDAQAFVPRLFELGAAGVRNIAIEPSTLEDAYFDIAGASIRGDGEEQAPA